MVERMDVRAIISGLVICAFVLVGGCQNASEEEGPVLEPAPEVATEPPSPLQDQVQAGPQADTGRFQLRLPFVTGQTVAYRVTAESERSINWEGDVSKKPATFKGGATGSRLEMVFDQEVLEARDNGDALIEVTIKSLAYVRRERGDVSMDFDSSRAEDGERPLARLIGQRYRFQMTPRGVVSTLVDMDPVRDAVQGATPEHRAALSLLSDRSVKARHEITALAALDAEAVNLHDRWSNVEKFSFGMLGAKVYERVYTLAEVGQPDGDRVAVIEMEGIPSAAMAEELYQTENTNPFAAMSDSSGSYTGRLDLNLDTGQIRDYVEQMNTQWLVADPSGAQSEDVAPAVLRMTATKLYKLERVD